MFGVGCLLIVCCISGSRASTKDPAASQLEIFLQEHPNPVGTATKFNGEPVITSETSTLNKNLLTNNFAIETLTHLTRERIPERVVHAIGSGTYGYFNLKKNISNICKAKLFSQVGKQTPVMVRFSPINGEKGASEVIRDGRGFAIKFYTEEGNFDLVGQNLPVFNIKDPIYFPSKTHANARNPKTNLFDYNMYWDFFTLRPESIYNLIYVNSDIGIPFGYGYMAGYSVHTYQVYNASGVSHFVRFHIEPCWGYKTLTSAQAANISSTQPYFYTQQLYNDLANGYRASWNVSVQILTLDDVINADFDVFDVTRILPTDKYPLTEIGELVLVGSPLNFFDEVEQLAFCPSNLVPGILGAPDKLFEARRLMYGDAHRYRLGGNVNNIRINRPMGLERNNFTESVLTYSQNGVPQVFWNKDMPIYFENSFSGPAFTYDSKVPEMYIPTQSADAPFDQVKIFYNSLPEAEKSRTVDNIVASLKNAATFLQERAIELFNQVDVNLGASIKSCLYQSS